MKLLTHVREGVERAAVVVDDRAFDLPKNATIIDLIADQARLDQVVKSSIVGNGLPLEQVFATAPLWPVAIRTFDTFSADGTDVPRFAFGNPWSICGPNDEVAMPPGCTTFDVGVQLGVIIGQPGHDIAEEDAYDHIAGFVLVNDWAARAEGRNDAATSIGPMIVTPDELPETLDLMGHAVVNGHTVAGGSFADMAWGFESLVAYASRGCNLGTGDLLTSGPLGGSRGRQPLQVGDIVTVSADGLGEQSCHVVEGEAALPISPRRQVSVVAQAS